MNTLDANQANELLDAAEKTVCYVSRSVAEQIVPPANSHLISISDDTRDQATIDFDVWASVSYHHFVDGEYDVDLITMFAMCNRWLERRKHQPLIVQNGDRPVARQSFPNQRRACAVSGL